MIERARVIDELIEAHSNLAFFILFLKAEKPNSIWGGISIDEAWKAYCRIVRPLDDPAEIEELLMKGLRSTREGDDE